MGADAQDGASYCQCGHIEAAHEHYRRGSDCGICGRDSCPAFRAAPAQPAAVDGDGAVAVRPGSQSA